LDAEITYLQLKNIALQEFPDIVVSALLIRGPVHTAKSLRVFFVDNSFLEIWISGKKYSYHWQRTGENIYGHDNAPHKKHKHIKTFPKHFHYGSENNTKESSIADNPEAAIRDFLDFIKKNI